MQPPFRSRIEVPNHLARALDADQNLGGETYRLVDGFSIWLGRNQTIFFPEFTDHGIDHVSNVLISAQGLISSEAWPLVAAADAAAIVASALLHDCAMHLTIDGFFELVDGQVEYRQSRIYRNERSWAQEFNIFQQEAARWDASKLMSVFGDHHPAELLKSGRIVSDRQKLLIGEFLRRHHARLAHQIALNHVPGVSDGPPFSPFSGFSEELRDLFGFLARSHNLPIRAATDVLQPMRRRVYLQVHAPFVMAVLRIADYIQIDSARAPTQILQLRGLKSPISRSEWAKHHAVLELNQAGDDPEALNVIADPRSVEIFSGLRLLFKDLQRELDESWALLGEVYGRVSDLKPLGLTVRRLVSNLDDPDDFEERNEPPYIPRELRLTTANAELLDLLVGPLYGNRPSVGVRELLQNAVDAALERASFEQRRNLSGEYTPLVEVELEVHTTSQSFIRISDNGVGMTLETVEDYFLRAGASFRKSQWWKAEFVTDAGTTSVRRSGRFGVGVLAAFLIGDRISVTTRHFLDGSGAGLTFNLAMDGSLVEVKRVPAEVGTTISIEFDAARVVDALVAETDAAEHVRFCDWFLYGSPTIKYRIFRDSNWAEAVPWLTLKLPLVSEGSPWTPVFVHGFDGVYWSFELEEDRHQARSGFIACNGIFVSHDGYRSEFPDIDVADFGGGAEVKHPALLVDDPDGRFPLNIQRSGLAENEYPFKAALESSIAAAYAREFYLALSGHSVNDSIFAAIEAVNARLLPFHDRGAGTVLGVCSDGWFPLEESLLERFRPSVVLYEMFTKPDFNGGLSRIPLDYYRRMIAIPWLFDGGSFNSIHFVRGLLDESHWRNEAFYRSGRRLIAGYRFFMRNDVKDYLAKKGNLPKFIWRQLRVVAEYEGWTVFDEGDDVFDVDDAQNIIELVRETDSRLIAIAGYSDEAGEEEGELSPPSPFAHEWLEMVPTIVFNSDGKQGEE